MAAEPLSLPHPHLKKDFMQDNKDDEMKKKILDNIIQNASKLMGDKAKGKHPAAMMIDIEAHPMGDDMPHPEAMHEEEMEDPKEEMLEAMHPEMEDAPMEEDGEPSDALKKLIEMHLMKRGKI